MNKTPKEQRHEQEVINRKGQQHTPNATGMVINYDRTRNTATVIMTSNKSNSPGNLLRNVPCPLQPGIQNIAPEVGRLCWVSFKGDNNSNPVITHFFSPSYYEVDRLRHSQSHIDTPRFMLEM